MTHIHQCREGEGGRGEKWWSRNYIIGNELTFPSRAAFYWSCRLAGVQDAKERDTRDWNAAKK